MPFDFGDFAEFADSGFDAISSFDANDLGSIVDIDGAEFLDSDTFTSFEVPIDDISDLGGYDQVGSFAGDADWYDAYGGEIDSFPSAVDVPEDPFEAARLSAIENEVPGPTEFDVIKTLPPADQIKAIASQVTQDFTGFVKSVPAIIKAYEKVAPVVNLAANALGVQNPINQIIGPAKTLSGVAGAAIGIANAISTGNIVSSKNTPVVASNGIVGGTFRELNAAETLELERRNLDPSLVNSYVPASGSGNTPVNNYDTAVATRDSLTPVVADLQTKVDNARNNISLQEENIISYQNQLDNPDLTDDERAAIEYNIQSSYQNISVSQEEIDNTEPLIISTSDEIAKAEQTIASTNSNLTKTANAVVGQVVNRLTNTTFYNPQTGKWSVFNNTTNTTIQSNLSEQEAISFVNNLNITNGSNLAEPNSPNEDPFERARLDAIAAGDTPINLSGFDSDAGARALVDQARQQQTVRDLRENKAQSSDWRVRLRLAPNSQYLYNAPGNPGDPASGPGIMAPLKVTDGVIFPYTPAIDTAYKADYDQYDLTHSNYRGYFYKGSHVDAINLRAQFTAQDTEEANYLLAVIHFFRSATKMFYGQDSQRGAPPPLVYLNGYGDYQFNEHPCAISQFNYQLPPDVDYIRAQSALNVGTNMLANRIRNPIANNPLAYSVNRLLNSNLLPGALDFRPSIANNLPTGSPTYVPTKMEISITLLPIQSRQQVSKNFSLKSFANGNLLRNGFW